MGNPVARASPKFRALTVFHDHIFQAIRKQHWQMARELIAQCRRLSGASQKMYDLHLARIAITKSIRRAKTGTGRFGRYWNNDCHGPQMRATQVIHHQRHRKFSAIILAVSLIQLGGPHSGGP